MAMRIVSAEAASGTPGKKSPRRKGGRPGPDKVMLEEQNPITHVDW